MPEINLEPFPYDRVRFGKGRTHNSPKYSANKKALRLLLGRHARKPLKGPLVLYLNFFVKASKGKLSHLKDFPCKTPDLDNYVKAFLDSAQGVLFNDDCQICSFHANKRYCVGFQKPRIEFSLFSMVAEGELP